MSSLPVYIEQQPSDAQLVSILDKDYQDELLVSEANVWSLYTSAVKQGYINKKGFITEKGKLLVESQKVERELVAV